MKKFMSLLLSALFILSLVPMTVGAEAAESWNSFIYYQDGPVFSVEATEFVGDASYKFIAAAYDRNHNLIAVKFDDTETVDGTLTAEVDFEEGNVEADPSIDYVRTMLWKSFTDVQPVAESGYFDIAAQTVTGDVYSNLTNGFYEPVTDTYSTSKYYLWRTANTSSYPCGYEGIQSYSLNPVNALCDNNPTSTGGAANIAAGNYKGHYVNELNTVTAIDRVVAYYGHTGNVENDVRFYLSNVAPSWSTDATTKESLYLANFNEADTTDVEYLGYRGDSESYAAGKEAHDGYRLVFDASGDAYKYIVAAYEFATTGGYVKELQAYKKVTNQDVISEFKIKASWDSLTYNQNGPVFSVNATGFSTNATEPAFVATATKADGTTIVKEEAINAAGTPLADVDFEYDEETRTRIEADATISSVAVKVVDKATDTVLVEEKVFDIAEQTVTDNVYSNLTNGFYEPVTNTEGVSYTSRWSMWKVNASYADGLEPWDSRANATGINDNNLTTTYFSTTFCGRTDYAGQYVQELSATTNIDRVVACYGKDSVEAEDVRFYLSNVAPNLTGTVSATDTRNAYLLNFTEQDTEQVNYLGYRGASGSYASSTTLPGGWQRIVFDGDGTAYKYLVASYQPETNGGAVSELQAYKKVTGSIEIPSNK